MYNPTHPSSRQCTYSMFQGSVEYIQPVFLRPSRGTSPVKAKKKIALLLAQQSGAHSRGEFRDFQPNPIQPSPTFSFWALKPVYKEAFKPVSGSKWQYVAVCGTSRPVDSLWYPRCHMHLSCRYLWKHTHFRYILRQTSRIHLSQAVWLM